MKKNYSLNQIYIILFIVVLPLFSGCFTLTNNNKDFVHSKKNTGSSDFNCRKLYGVRAQSKGEMLFKNGKYNKAFKCFSRACLKNGDSCYKNATKLKKLIGKDKVLKLFKLSCENGSGRGCLFMADEYRSKLINPYILKAIQNLDRECRENRYSSCGELVLLQNYFAKSTKDIKRAKVLSEKGCLGGDLLSCKVGFYLNYIYLKTAGDIKKLNGMAHKLTDVEYLRNLIAKAKKYRKKLNNLENQCQKGSPKSCYDATIMILSRSSGRFTFTLKKFLTELNVKSFNPGSVLVWSKSNKSTETMWYSPEVFNYLKKGCNLNHINSCKKLGFLQKLKKIHGERSKINKIKKLLTQSCLNGDYYSCFKLYEENIFGGSPTNRKEGQIYLKKGIAFVKKAVRRKKIEAFSFVAEHYRRLPWPGKKGGRLRKILKKGCEENSFSSCYHYGRLLEKIGLRYRARGRAFEKETRRKFNIAAWAYKKSCSKAFPESCLEFSRFNLNGTGVDKNTEKASYYKKLYYKYISEACNDGDGSSCLKTANAVSGKSKLGYLFRACYLGKSKGCVLALKRLNIKATSLWLRTALQLSKISCDLGDFDECKWQFAVGMISRNRNWSLYDNNLKKLCSIGKYEACWLYGFTKAKNAYKNSDIKKSITSFKKACNSSTILPCAHLENLKSDFIKIKKFSSECTKNNAKDCMKEGEILLNPIISRKLNIAFREVWRIFYQDIKSPKLKILYGKNKKEYVRELYKKACNLGEGSGCLKYTLTIKNDKSQVKLYNRFLKKSVVLLKKSCFAMNGHSCAILGKILLDGTVRFPQKVGISKTSNYWFSLARENFKKKCLKGSGSDCFHAGELAEELPPEKRNIKQITSLMEKGCKLNNSNSCVFMGNFYFSKTKSTLGGQFLGKACKLKNYISCYNAGRFYERRGSSKDIRKARYFYKKACKRKIRKACFALIQMRK